MYRSTLRLIAAVLTCGLLQSADASSDALNCTQGQRTMTFSASQATIDNLDVSPDGKHVVFDMLGDLYVVPIAGGEAMPLSRGTDWDVRPVWSPDGRQVAFISDRAGSDQVFVIDSKGTGPVSQLSSGTSLLTQGPEGVIGAAEWMPDSTAVVVNGVRLPIDPEMAGGTRSGVEVGSLYHGNGTALHRFRYQPRTASSAEPGYTLWTLDAVTGEWRDTGESLQGGVMSSYEAPLLSRDGRWLIYRERSPIGTVSIPGFTPADGKKKIDVMRVRDRHTGVTRVLLGPGVAPGWRDNSDADGLGFAARGRFAITPDSKFLIAAYGGGLHRISLERGEIESIPLSVRVEQCLEPIAQPTARIGDSLTFDVKNFRGTTLRSDGRQLVFSALRRLYVADPREGRPRLLAEQQVGQFQPAYSPDGKWIAYASWSETEGGHLWRVPSAGGVPERLTRQPGYYQTPIWSPDGKSIVFVGSDDISQKRPGFMVYVHGGTLQRLSLDDGIIRRLPVEARFGHPPSFSQDGRRIWYAAYEIDQDQLKLHSIGIDGDQVREEAASKLLSMDSEEKVVPSPDGRFIALVRHGDLHLVHCKQPLGSERSNADACVLSRITHEGAYDPRWRAKGSELEWAFAEMHYRARTEDLVRWLESDDRDKTASPIIESVAARLSVPRMRGRGVVVLSGARIITMRGDEVIENGSVRVEDGIIAQVGKAGEVDVPAGATVLDLQGKTLLPGFIDAHAHLTDLPRDLLDANNGEALIYLAYGITTAKDPSNGGDHAYTYTELVRAGDMVGPRLFGTEGLLSRNHSITALDDAVGLARRTRRLGGTYLKYHTGWDRSQRRWMMEAARRSGLGVAAHWAATNYAPGRLNLSTIIDGATTSEHALSDGQEKFTDIVDFLARSGASMNFATIAGGGGYPKRYWNQVKDDPRMRRFYIGREPRERELPQPQEDEHGLPALTPSEARNARLINDIANRGGDVAIGSHGDFDGIGFHLEMWAHVRGGMAPHAVLRAATLHGARATGVESELGSIESGKIADLIILDESPLEDIRNTLTVERVMQGGLLRDAMTLDEVWPQRKPLPEWRMKGAEPKLDQVSSRTVH